ncbi:NucA/NucB deoxyribonuclease domain-containing protein [Spirillospora sp. NPDC046719]
MAAGASYSGTFSYLDTTRSHHEPELAVNITPRIPEADTTTTGHGVLQIRVRCDDEFEGLLAGCINPAYIPTMTSMTQLPDIADNIRGIQARGGYGVPGKPAFALHREADPAEQRENREEACNIRVTGPRPAGKFCDEYPFASTKEGGNALTGMGHGWAFVPTDQQNKQAGFITGFYKQNRVIDNDPFYVQV